MHETQLNKGSDPKAAFPPFPKLLHGQQQHQQQQRSAGSKPMGSSQPIVVFSKSSVVSKPPAATHSAAATVSGLSLESYMLLLHALTRGNPDRVVQKVSAIEESYYKTAEIKQLLAVHGVSVTGSRVVGGGSSLKRELLDRAVGLRLIDPTACASAAAGASTRATGQEQVAGASDVPPQGPVGGVRPITVADLMALGWMSADASVAESRAGTDTFCFPRRRAAPSPSAAGALASPGTASAVVPIAGAHVAPSPPGSAAAAVAPPAANEQQQPPSCQHQHALRPQQQQQQQQPETDDRRAVLLPREVGGP